MTATELESYKMTVPGTMPFACGANASVTVPSATSSENFSMPKGFGSNFDLAPTNTAAQMIQRGQINYLGKMASLLPFLGKVGCDYWTFDPAVATDSDNSDYGIGGYPKGAILTYIDNGCFLKVISLVDDNQVDFTGKTDTTVYTDITNGTVDGINWQYLYLDPKDLIDQSILVEVPDIYAPRQSTGILGCFKAAYDGALIVSGSVTMTDLTPTTSSEGGGGSTIVYDTTQMNFKIVVSAGKSSLSDLGGWVPCDLTNSNEANGTVIYSSGLIAESQLTMVEKDKWYGIGYGATFCSVTGSDMQIKMVTE